MARPQVYDDALRRRLLEATVELVGRDGYDAVSLREIARVADTSTSAVYALFGSKQALYAAVIADGFATLAAQQSGASVEGLGALARAYRTWALEHPELYRLMFDGAALDSFPAHESADDELPASLGALYEAVAARMPGAPPEEVFPRVIATWAQAHGAVSIELAGIVPDVVAPEAVFEAVLASIAAGFDRRGG